LPTYTNLDGKTPDKGLLDILKWQLGKPRRTDPPFVTPRRPNDGGPLRAASANLTWIGHATFVQRLGGQVVATDPIWSSRIHSVKRLAEPGVALGDCPRIDVATVSHAHYDHMDVPTLRRLGPDTAFVVPKDNADVLRKAGLPNVTELGWWESTTIGDLRITLVPAQHWSMRMPWDRNQRLWGGFVYESLRAGEGTSYHAGDTAFCERVFREIGQRFPRIDWAMLPIGAYDPTWFMSPQHMGPEEAGRAYELLGAKHFVAMHWGTFKLTDEPLGEPPERLRAWWREKRLPEERLWILDLGETRAL
jgi:L-ascorbate metabolism protein UlaG (beta-lactamase superfamily)